MRKAAVVLVCALAVALFVAVGMMQSVMVLQRVAAVSNVRGSVEIRPRGGNAFVNLGDRQRVAAGDVLQTGADSGLILSWIDNSRIRLGPETTMKVLKCQVNKARQSETYLFRLEVGKIWVRVIEALSKTSKFEISTPTATAAVRGTVFSVAVTRDGVTQVSVLDGDVTLKAAGKELRVGEGQQASAGAGISGDVAALTPEEEAAWEQAKDVTKPSLTIAAPASEKLPADGTTLTVRGVAESGAKVTVNGRPVELELGGKFETQVAIPEDADQLDLTVRAEDRKGFSTVVVKRLSRP